MNGSTEAIDKPSAVTRNTRMTHIENQEDATRALYEIQQALINVAALELLNEETRIAELARDNLEFSVEWSKLIFAWWDETRAENWRITDFEIKAGQVYLRAVRGMGREVTHLMLRDAASVRLPESLSADLPIAERRLQYGAQLSQIMAHHFSDVRVERLSVREPRRNSAVSKYARLVLHEGKNIKLAFGVSEAESQNDIDETLASAIVWLDQFNQQRAAKAQPQANRLWLCVPRERSRTLAERLSLLDTVHLNAKIELFEVDECEGGMFSVRPFTQAELLNEHPHELKWPLEICESGWRKRIVELAPELIEVREDLNGEAETYSIHGLEFARAKGSGRAQIFFGVAYRAEELSTQTGNWGINHQRKRLTESSFSELKSLVEALIKYRSVNTPDKQHPFFRLRAEAWLESLIRRDIRQLDPTLDARYVYSQVPAWRGDERAMIDLLTVNNEGRLVIIEVKASEDPQLPLQGLDYWIKVEQARRRGDFRRRGLFGGVELIDASAILYLVAPQLRFHRSFAIVSRCLASAIEVYRVGVNLNWREGVRVRAIERTNIQKVQNRSEE